MSHDEIEWGEDGRIATVTKMSPVSGKIHSRTIIMSRKDYHAWHFSHVLIQRALPYLTPGEREFLMTGITDEEWDKEFKTPD